MKNSMIKYLACAAVALGLATTVQAIPSVTGGLSFGGGITVVGGPSFLTGTQLTFQNVSVTPGEALGSFSPLNPGYVFVGSDTFGPININPDSVVAGTLFSFKASGVTYSLTGATTPAVATFKSSRSIIIDGTGTMNVDGFAPTVGTWNVSAQSQGGVTFSFSSSAAVPVPDGGMTAILLGAALSGLGLLRRKLA